MPRYDYQCPTCGLEREEQRPVAERDARSVCPKDGSVMERLPSAPGFKLKGRGFHINDYGKG